MQFDATLDETRVYQSEWNKSEGEVQTHSKSASINENQKQKEL